MTPNDFFLVSVNVSPALKAGGIAFESAVPFIMGGYKRNIMYFVPI